MSNLLKDPLLHFLAAGLALFLLFDLVAGDAADYDAKVITVDREALLTFTQYRSRAFEPEMAARTLDSMSDEQLEKHIAEYVREEALHREAKALGMDQNDYIIKRRMIQSIEFITDGIATATVDVTDAEVAAHYAANRDKYYVNPYITFTHVFFDRERRDRDTAYRLANVKLAELNDTQTPFSDAPRHGDRFPFFVNYVERDPMFVTSHFGPMMAEQVFALEPAEGIWRGPFESEYGLHLVQLTRKAEGRYPALEEIADAVREDAERDAVAEQKDKAIQAIVETYEIRRTYQRELVGLLQ